MSSRSSPSNAGRIQQDGGLPSAALNKGSLPPPPATTPREWPWPPSASERTHSSSCRAPPSDQDRRRPQPGGRVILQGTITMPLTPTPATSRDSAGSPSCIPTTTGGDRRAGTIGTRSSSSTPGPVRRVRPGGRRRLDRRHRGYIKQLRPEIRIIGVEPETPMPWTARSKPAGACAGSCRHLRRRGRGATGGEETFRLCRQFVDEMVVVTNDEICAAIKDVFQDRRSCSSRRRPRLRRAQAVCGARAVRHQQLIAIASGPT